MNLKTTTVIAFVGLIVFVIVLYFSGQHTGTSTAPTSTRAAAPAFSRKVGETFQCGHGFLATLTPKDAQRAGVLIRAGDKNALSLMTSQGRLIAIEPGTTVTIEDRDIWNATESFRVQGNPDTRYASIGEVR
jgi:hypothetical protein